ncbi:MAG TPA: nucleotide exchange factor GrpE [Bacillaceae bacterium]
MSEEKNQTEPVTGANEEVSNLADQTADASQETAENPEEQMAGEETLNQTDMKNQDAANAARIEELEAKLDESENRYLRLLADFDNFRRRTQLDREAAEKYRAQELITNLLPAIDNFERAMQIEIDNEQAKALLDGVSMVYRSIIEALKQEGAEQIEAVGKEFDPNLHQAVMQTEEEEMASNMVVEEFQKGYKLKDRIIRPSMVKVSK